MTVPSVVAHPPNQHLQICRGGPVVTGNGQVLVPSPALVRHHRHGGNLRAEEPLDETGDFLRMLHRQTV